MNEKLKKRKKESPRVNITLIFICAVPTFNQKIIAAGLNYSISGQNFNCHN